MLKIFDGHIYNYYEIHTLLKIIPRTVRNNSITALNHLANDNNTFVEKTCTCFVPDTTPIIHIHYRTTGNKKTGVKYMISLYFPLNYFTLCTKQFTPIDFSIT